jgi:putative tryptophan/tyrosine transport system substrate-binding protein
MRRRDFIEGIVGSAAAWPLAARAQQGESVRRIGVLMNRAASDPQGQVRVAAFKETMQQLGWTEGRNVQIDVRWGEDDFDLEQKNAAQLIALAPEIIFALGTLSVASLRRLSRTADRLCLCRRSARRWFRRQPEPTGRQCDGIYALRIHFEREMGCAA